MFIMCIIIIIKQFLKNLKKYWPKINHESEEIYLKLLEIARKNVIFLRIYQEEYYAIIVNILVSIIKEGRSCV